MPVWGAILLAIVATSIMNAGLALQKRGASALPKLGREKGAFGAMFKNKTWALGFAGLLAGWGLYVYSTKFAPISIIQPTLGLGLAVLALFSIFYLKERMKVLEWLALSGMFAGMILLGISAEKEKNIEQPDWPMLLTVTGAVLGLALLAYLLRKSGRLSGVRTDSLLGMISGLFVGLGAIYMRAMHMHVGFQQDLIAYAVCLPIFVIAFLVGIGVMQGGFQHGKALVVVALEAVLSKVVAIIGGMMALGEHLPQDAKLAGMRIAAFALILFGTAVLSRFGGKEVAEKIQEKSHN